MGNAALDRPIKCLRIPGILHSLEIMTSGMRNVLFTGQPVDLGSCSNPLFLRRKMH
jgi:hypothetical protein